MAVNFKGGFKIGGVEYVHPLNTKQIQFLLELLASTTFTGKDVQMVFEIAYLLQEEYKLVSKKEKAEAKALAKEEYKLVSKKEKAEAKALANLAKSAPPKK